MIFIAPLVFFICYFLLNNIAKYYGLYDKNEFQNNKNIIPLTGGIYFYISLITVSLFYSSDKYLYLMTIGSVGMFLMGLIDDLKNISFRSRFIFQILFVFLYIIYFDLFILDYGFFVLNDSFIVFSLIFTTFAVVGLTNAFNFIDGVDGLSSSLFFMAILFLKIYTVLFDSNTYFYELDIILLLIISFIFINKKITNLKQIYLGDSGSMLIGFLISIYLIYFSNNLNIISPTIVYWFVAVPIFDFFSVIFIRIINKKNPMVGDKYHFHHFLVYKGYSNNIVLLIMIFLSIMFATFGIFLDFYVNNFLNFILFVIFIILSIVIRVSQIKNLN